MAVVQMPLACIILVGRSISSAVLSKTTVVYAWKIAVHPQTYRVRASGTCARHLDVQCFRHRPTRNQALIRE